MSKYILRFPKEIKPPEHEKRWSDAVTLLYTQWKKDPMDENNLVCLTMEAWYAILELDYLETARLLLEYYKCDPGIPLEIEAEQEKIHDILSEAMRFGIEKYNDSVLFNMYIGYAASVKPLHFADFIDISKWGDDGMAMIQKAFTIDPKDVLTRLFYYASTNRWSKKYLSTSQKFWTEISLSDWGDTAVQKYFFDMLDGDKYTRQGDG